MAREYGKIVTRIWGDADFRTLTGNAQRLYFQLLSQPDLSMAGVLTTAIPRWSGQVADQDHAAVSTALDELEAHRYTVTDHRTMETLIRSFIRNDGGWKSPTTMMGIDSSIRAILSEPLKAVIRDEVQRIDTSALPSKISEKTGRSTRQVVEGIARGIADDFHALPLPHPIPHAEGYAMGTNARTHTTTTATTPEPAPTPTPTPTTSKQEAFDEWWTHWPKKKAIGDARKAFPKALTSAGLAALIEGADAYAAWVERNRVEDQYIVGPGRWLREERWADELTDRTPASGNGRPTATDRMRAGWDLTQQLAAQEQQQDRLEIAP